MTKGFLSFVVFLLIPSLAPAQTLEAATFAGGCFWCMEPPFEKLAGVKEVTSGYIGGSTANPTYEQVSSGSTGHAEAVQVLFDPKEIAYEKLLDVFWKNIDPTDAEGQFVDRGRQYRSGIFYHNENQKRVAERSKERLSKSGRFQKPIVTEITLAGTFTKRKSTIRTITRKIRYDISSIDPAPDATSF